MCGEGLVYALLQLLQSETDRVQLPQQTLQLQAHRLFHRIWLAHLFGLQDLTQLLGFGGNAALPGPAPCVRRPSGQAAVRIRGPSGVTATVCSWCAARLPSALRSVQPSSSIR